MNLRRVLAQAQQKATAAAEALLADIEAETEVFETPAPGLSGAVEGSPPGLNPLGSPAGSTQPTSRTATTAETERPPPGAPDGGSPTHEEPRIQVSTEIVSSGYRIVESQGGRQPGEYPVITAVTDNAYESELALAFKPIDRDYWLVHPGYIARTLAGAGHLLALRAPDENTAREWVQFVAALYVKAVRS